MPAPSRVLGLASPFLALVVLASAQAAPVLSEVSIMRTNDEGRLVTKTVSGVNSAAQQRLPVDVLNVSHGYRGQASAEFQTLRAGVSAGGRPPSTWSDFVTSSRFVADTVVSGSGSGSTALNLSLRIDGNSRADGGVSASGLPLFSSRGLEVYSNADLRYRIVDLDWIDPELGTPRTLVDFRFGAGVAWTGGHVHWADGSWEDYGSLFRGVNAWCDVGCQPGSGTWNWSGSWNDGGYLNHIPGAGQIDADTGLLNFSFDATIGHELRIEATLGATVHTWGCDVYCSFGGASDFSHSFDAELTAQDPGITLEGLRAGIAAPLPNDNNPVPEPSSAALVAVALFGLRRVTQSASRANRAASASTLR